MAYVIIPFDVGSITQGCDANRTFRGNKRGASTAKREFLPDHSRERISMHLLVIGIGVM